MIDAIEIDNFQSHKGTAITFGPGVNVVTGTSDSGKSAVVRALVWAVSNRPQGFGFRSTFADKGQATRVGVTFTDGQWVVRERDDRGMNRYSIEGQELEALRADVPDEVEQVLNLEEYNVQGQHDAYFLLQSSAGEVARMLNDVVGLDVIDSLLKVVNSMVLDARREADRAGTEAVDLQGQIEGYAFLKDLDKHVEKLDVLTQERDDRRAEVAVLSKIAQELELANRDVANAEAWLAVDGDLTKLDKGADELRSIKWEVGELERIADELEDATYKLSRHEAIMELTEKAREVHRVAEERRVLDSICSEIELSRDGEAKALGQLEQWRVDEQELLEKVTICPMCRTTGLSGEKRDNVIEYFQGGGK